MGDDKDFKVSDRRPLTREGDLRENGETAFSPEEKAPAGDVPPSGDGKIDLAAFLLSLGTQASLLLEGEGDRGPDLAGAREVISILEMLEEKTEGGRTAAESGVLEALLFELRMGYVARTRQAGA